MRLFELRSVCITGCKRSDGSYPAREYESGLFSSAENAEAFMRLIIEKEKKYYRFHCFFVYEKVLDPDPSRQSGPVCGFEAVRSYLADGSLYCDSPWDDAGKKPFRGRAKETVVLKTGGIAWCCGHESIYPCLVAELPITTARYRRHAEELGRDWGLDASDDCYMVYTCGDGHMHPECWRCMPYYGTVSKRTLQRLHACRRREEAETSASV